MGLSVADLLLVKKIKELLEENNQLQREEVSLLREIKSRLKNRTV